MELGWGKFLPLFGFRGETVWESGKMEKEKDNNSFVKENVVLLLLDQNTSLVSLDTSPGGSTRRHCV